MLDSKVFSWFYSPIRRLRYVGLIEGCTLVLLLGVAVPLKHIFHSPGAVSVLGPVHGLVFSFYIVTLVENIALGVFTRSEAIRAFVVSVVPFGTFINDPAIRCKVSAMKEGGN